MGVFVQSVHHSADGQRNEVAVAMQWDVACKLLPFSEGLGTADHVTTANGDRR